MDGYNKMWYLHLVAPIHVMLGQQTAIFWSPLKTKHILVHYNNRNIENLNITKCREYIKHSKTNSNLTEMVIMLMAIAVLYNTPM
jgi:hypothetical protein